jgi:hypothetical protein
MDASVHALRLPTVKVMDSIDVKGSSFEKAGASHFFGTLPREKGFAMPGFSERFGSPAPGRRESAR